MLRQFYLVRNYDASGVSGTGKVAVGAVMPTGRVVVEWLGYPFTIAVHESLDALDFVHGHNGNTIIEWVKESE